MIAIKQLLCAVDFSDTSGYALQYAAELARIINARLSIVHVASAPEEMSPLSFGQLQNEFEQWTGKSNLTGLKVYHQILFGTPAKEILVFALKINADTIIIGNNGHGNMYSLFVGSVADNIIQASQGPVLLVKHPTVGLNS